MSFNIIFISAMLLLPGMVMSQGPGGGGPPPPAPVDPVDVDPDDEGVSSGEPDLSDLLCPAWESTADEDGGSGSGGCDVTDQCLSNADCDAGTICCVTACGSECVVAVGNVTVDFPVVCPEFPPDACAATRVAAWVCNYLNWKVSIYSWIVQFLRIRPDADVAAPGDGCPDFRVTCEDPAHKRQFVSNDGCYVEYCRDGNYAALVSRRAWRGDYGRWTQLYNAWNQVLGETLANPAADC